MSTRTRLVAGIATIGLAVSLSLAMAAPASALGSCAGSIASDGTYRTQCNSGTGQVRSWVACKSVISLGYYFNRVGDWVNKGKVSTARCGFGEWSIGFGGWENRG